MSRLTPRARAGAAVAPRPAPATTDGRAVKSYRQPSRVASIPDCQDPGPPWSDWPDWTDRRYTLAGPARIGGAR